MALITCSKCKKIIPASAATCPYCGEPYPAGARIVIGPKPGNSKGWIVFVVLALLIVLFVQWLAKGRSAETVPAVSLSQTSCQVDACPAGTDAMTVAAQQAFYTCRSEELTEYANFVLQEMISLTRQTGISPEISSKTGEPVVQGKDKLALDNYRAKAGVASFEEALSKCYRGTDHMKVVVLYNPKQSKNIYVADATDQTNKFWLPKSNLARVLH
jgi:hypothetical protein